MLFFDGTQPFATGSSLYSYQPATEHETTPRIILRVAIERFNTTASIDTGSPYVIIDPSITEALSIDNQTGIPQNNIWLRKDRLDGYLHRLTILFLADEGVNVSVEATVFVPELKPHQKWGEFPSIIGLNSCLERLRFAVDPADDKFYFGPLS